MSLNIICIRLSDCRPKPKSKCFKLPKIKSDLIHYGGRSENAPRSHFCNGHNGSLVFSERENFRDKQCYFLISAFSFSEYSAMLNSQTYTHTPRCFQIFHSPSLFLFLCITKFIFVSSFLPCFISLYTGASSKPPCPFTAPHSSSQRKKERAEVEGTKGESRTIVIEK